MSDERALIPQPAGGLTPISRLAERTLAEREERALVAARTLIVGPGGYGTISAAVEAAADGDTILVRPGRYVESVVVETKSVTIRGDGARHCVVIGCERGPALSLVDNRSTIVALTLVGGSRDLKGRTEATVWVEGGAPHLEGLRITGGGGVTFARGAAGSIGTSLIESERDGIYLIAGSSPRIDDNEISATGSGVFLLGGGNSPLIQANRITHGQQGIFIHQCSPRVEDNEILGSLHYGIGITGPEAAPTIVANRIHDVDGDGLYVERGASPAVDGNDIRDNAGAGIVAISHTTTPAIRHNTIERNAGGSIVIWDGADPVLEGNRVDQLPVRKRHPPLILDR